MIEIYAHGEKSVERDVTPRQNGDPVIEVRHLKFGELTEQQITLLLDTTDSPLVSTDVAYAISTALYNLWDLQGLLGDYTARQHKAALLEGRRYVTKETHESICFSENR